MEFNITNVELQCRICLDSQESTEEMTPLFDLMEGDFTLSYIFTNITNIEVSRKYYTP